MTPPEPYHRGKLLGSVLKRDGSRGFRRKQAISKKLKSKQKSTGHILTASLLLFQETPTVNQTSTFVLASRGGPSHRHPTGYVWGQRAEKTLGGDDEVAYRFLWCT